jgi:hypothetical protein
MHILRVVTCKKSLVFMKAGPHWIRDDVSRSGEVDLVVAATIKADVRHEHK